MNISCLISSLTLFLYISSLTEKKMFDVHIQIFHTIIRGCLIKNSGISMINR